MKTTFYTNAATSLEYTQSVFWVWWPFAPLCPSNWSEGGARSVPIRAGHKPLSSRVREPGFVVTSSARAGLIMDRLFSYLAYCSWWLYSVKVSQFLLSFWPHPDPTTEETVTWSSNILEMELFDACWQEMVTLLPFAPLCPSSWSQLRMCFWHLSSQP